MRRKRDLGEEEFYGGEEEKRSKEEREGEDGSKKKGDLGGQSKGKGTLIKEDIGRRRRRGGLWEGSEGSRIKAPWNRVLFDDDDDMVFHLRLGSVSADR